MFIIKCTYYQWKAKETKIAPHLVVAKNVHIRIPENARNLEFLKTVKSCFPAILVYRKFQYKIKKNFNKTLTKGLNLYNFVNSNGKK